MSSHYYPRKLQDLASLCLEQKYKHLKNIYKSLIWVSTFYFNPFPLEHREEPSWFLVKDSGKNIRHQDYCMGFESNI